MFPSPYPRIGRAVKPAPAWNYLVCNLLLVTIYYLAGQVGLSMTSLHAPVSPVWPPTGVAVAALLILGRNLWPGIFVGAFLVNAVTAEPLWAAGMIAVGNTLEALACVGLLRALIGARHPLSRPSLIIGFVFGAAIPASAIAASLGVTALCWSGIAAWKDAASLWVTWWFGDATGCLVITPLILAWIRKISWPWQKFAELIFLVVFVVLLSKLAFGTLLEIPIPDFGYLALPFLMLGAFRFGVRGATVISFFVSAEAALAARYGMGPFHGSNPNESMLLVQLYVATLAVTGLIVSSILAERERMSEEREILLAALRHRAEKLEETNSELRQFAWGASHDLKEPLRTITCHIQLLERKCRGYLDDEAREFIAYAVSGAHRMRRLIDDVLTYSRMQNPEQTTEWVECTDVVTDVMRSLKASIAEANAHIKIGPLPRVLLRQGHLPQLFQNLIGNAIKFRRGREPEIAIEAREGQMEWIFLVRDNGIGIDPAHIERIFRLFQRLHSQDQYEGTGLGLALCKRLVEQNGGRIWVESQVGTGSTFYFTLPMRQSEAAPPAPSKVVNMFEFRNREEKR
jgi:signal transduction histidine kinase